MGSRLGLAPFLFQRIPEQLQAAELGIDNIDIVVEMLDLLVLNLLLLLHPNQLHLQLVENFTQLVNALLNFITTLFASHNNSLTELRSN